MGQRARRADALAVYDLLRRNASTPGQAYTNSAAILEALTGFDMATRARTICEIAQVIVDRFNGEMPRDELALRSLPGVGDYLAQAVLCFGWGRRATLVDTSTMRASARINRRSERRRFQLRLDLHQLAGREGPDGPFNAAMLDLGSSVCLPESPRCDACPVLDHCAVGSDRDPDIQSELSAA